MPCASPVSSLKFQPYLKQQYLGKLFKKEKYCAILKKKLENAIKGSNTTQAACNNLKS